MTITNLNMINIGCGSILHKDWINVDIASTNPDVIQADIANGLPFDSGFSDVCYSSHLLEHMPKAAANAFLAECHRVLKKDGVIRLVVPDLEAIARQYLIILDDVASGNHSRSQDYDWILLEMYDQVVRNKSGGEMLTFLMNLSEDKRSYVRSRIGAEADSLWQAKTEKKDVTPHINSKYSLIKRIRLKLSILLVRWIAGEAAQNAFQQSLFRSGGEVHQWMYDRYSLACLLKQAGFIDIKVCEAYESRIPNFSTYGLDMLKGYVRKPDSLFIEAIKL